MICADNGCGCALQTTTLDLSGSGTPEDPWVLEQIEFADLNDIENDIAAILAALDALGATYVNVTGDEMSGPLRVVTTGGGIAMVRTDADAPFLEWFTQAGVSIGYVQGDDLNDVVALAGRSGYGARILTNGVEVARWTTSGIYLLAKTATGIGTTGCEVQPAGSIWSTRSANGSNFISNKTGAGDANGQIHFDVQSAGTTIGSITRATGSTVAFNTSSDETLKTNIVDIDDQLALYWMRVVQPMLFEFISEPGVVHGGYIAQRVAAAWPQAIELGIVTPGTDGDDDHGPVPWMIDLSKFVPFIHAGLQAVDVRLSVVEGMVSDHADRIGDLEDRLAALEAVVIASSQNLEK